MTVQEPLDRQRPRGSIAPASTRRPDYRLRGLDLGAQDRVEAPVRAGRKKDAGRGRRRRRLLVQWGLALILVAATAVVLRTSVVAPYTIRSTSMVPNIWPGTSVLVVRPSLLTGPMHVGDVVVFHRPAHFDCNDAGANSQDLVKRVIGRPGQTIWSVGERIYVDGQPLAEPLGWYKPAVR